MPEAVQEQPRAAGSGPIDVRTAPDRYRHWRLHTEGRIATLDLDVDEIPVTEHLGQRLLAGIAEAGLHRERTETVPRYDPLTAHRADQGAAPFLIFAQTGPGLLIGRRHRVLGRGLLRVEDHAAPEHAVQLQRPDVSIRYVLQAE